MSANVKLKTARGKKLMRPKVQLDRVLGPARRHVMKGLMAFNKNVIGPSDYKPLAVTLREDDEIVGGLVGYTWAGWLYVELFWIDEKFRGKGHGRSLMKKAEAEARKRGIRNAYLNSFSFQAPGFYKKLGYREFARLKNYPLGHTQHWLQKAL